MKELIHRGRSKSLHKNNRTLHSFQRGFNVKFLNYVPCVKSLRNKPMKLRTSKFEIQSKFGPRR